MLPSMGSARLTLVIVFIHLRIVDAHDSIATVEVGAI